VRVPGCLPYGAFQALYYEVVVGPGRSLRATVRPTAAAVQVQILSGCNALGCRAISPERALWTNPGSAPASALVLVAFTARPTLASSVDVALELLGSPAEACAGALRLTPGVPSPEQVVAPTAAAALCPNDPGGSPSAGAMQPFRVTIPPGEMLTAVARSLTPGLAVATAVTATCGAQSCLGYMRAAPAAEQTLIFENTGSRALEVVLGVAGSPASAAGRFVVTATTAAPAGGTCAGAPAFEAAGWYPGRTATNPAACTGACASPPAASSRATRAG
jgi:hypothetical protein